MSMKGDLGQGSQAGVTACHGLPRTCLVLAVKAPALGTLLAPGEVGWLATLGRKGKLDTLSTFGKDGREAFFFLMSQKVAFKLIFGK